MLPLRARWRSSYVWSRAAVLLRTAGRGGPNGVRPGRVHRRGVGVPATVARHADRGFPRGQATMSRPAGILTRDDVAGELRLRCDVVIGGSGAGGATMAAELAEAGIDVVVLEDGGYHATESFQTGMGQALRTLYRDGGGGSAIGTPP